MELASSLILSKEIEQTMVILPRNNSRVGVSKCFHRSAKLLGEVSSSFKLYLEEQRRSLFDGYFEMHQKTQLLYCQSGDGVAVVFCPSDHTGVWAGLIVKGSLGKRTQIMLEGIAKDRGLI